MEAPMPDVAALFTQTRAVLKSRLTFSWFTGGDNSRLLSPSDVADVDFSVFVLHRNVAVGS